MARGPASSREIVLLSSIAWPRLVASKSPWARGVVWIILSAFEADDGGSNPPGPAIIHSQMGPIFFQ